MPRRESDPALEATVAQPGSDATLTTRSDAPPSVSSKRLSLPNYEVGALLGRGGMGDVVLGRDRTIGRDVAIKQLRLDRPSAEASARFLREARIQARLEHPAIVPVHELGTDEHGQPYFTMKKLTGTTLQELLAADAPPPRQRLLRMFVEVCQALEFAHARGVVHRDLKPSNIMIGDFGEVYVLDWGLARVLAEEDAGSSIGFEVESLDGMTQAGAMLGTPGYMAPEQIEDAGKVTTSADVYALGAILFEILTGESLHPRGLSALASTLKGIEGGPHARRPDREVPPELDALCVAALATSPVERPDIKQLHERLQQFLDGDRDVALRRQRAKEAVVRARDAFDSGDVRRRAEAMQHAGHALVLDPSSQDAMYIVSKLMFEPPKQLPDELRADLAAGELAVQQRQGRVAMLSFLVVLAYIAITATNGVYNAALVAGIAGYVVLHASVVWRITQRSTTLGLMIVVAVGNAMLVALLSRTLGSMIIVPAVTCLMALSLTSYPMLIDRKWTVIALLVASWVVPLVLEYAGILAPTWMITGDMIELTSPTLAISPRHTAAILIGSNVVTIIVFGLFSNALAASRRDAMRTSEIQAWHLKQMLPTATASSATGS